MDEESVRPNLTSFLCHFGSVLSSSHPPSPLYGRSSTRSTPYRRPKASGPLRGGWREPRNVGSGRHRGVGRTWHRLTLDLWLAKDNRFLNPKSSYKRILMAPSCRFIPASWVGPYLVTLVGLRPPSLLVPLPTRVAAPPAGNGRGT